MAEILDNQEITTDTLNNIAIDLGATTFNGFTANKFGVDELNNITKSLVSRGVTQGGNKCEPYLADGDLYINTGTIIFDTGAKIRITTPQKIEKQTSTYIYALNDTARNIAEIVVSETKPTIGDFVLLAYVGENGVLTDKREWATSNVLLSSNSILEKKFFIPTSPNLNDISIEEVELNWGGWNYIIYPSLLKNVELIRVVHLSDNEEAHISVTTEKRSNNFDYWNLTLTRNGTKLTIKSRVLYESAANKWAYSLIFV